MEYYCKIRQYFSIFPYGHGPHLPSPNLIPSDSGQGPHVPLVRMPSSKSHFPHSPSARIPSLGLHPKRLKKSHKNRQIQSPELKKIILTHLLQNHLFRSSLFHVKSSLIDNLKSNPHPSTQQGHQLLRVQIILIEF